ncbi:MAG TPA: polyphosphate kinase 2 family protein [Syntrophorhabdaceae bacterium]|nr:polyphosphate kinase 2 family protein [Syntrophorhabdaceae bacterium]
MDYHKLFKIKPGAKVRLDKVDPGFTANHKNKISAETEMARHQIRLCDLQYLLYAENNRSLLICLQALDAGGKDGTINKVFSALNPQGTHVYSFKPPSKEEAEHDFLWRVHKRVPAKGEVVIFNRSHYEDVLVTRVHNLVSKDVWSKRYDVINEFEKDLADSGTKIVKFFLYISPEEQLRRFEQRLNDPARRWKISESDYAERELWNKYMKAYEDALSRTSTEYAPWYIIPANRKWFRNLAISRIVMETLESMHLKTPKPSVDIDDIRRKYHSAAMAANTETKNKKQKKKDKKNKQLKTEKKQDLKLKMKKKESKTTENKGASKAKQTTEHEGS